MEGGQKPKWKVRLKGGGERIRARILVLTVMVSLLITGLAGGQGRMPTTLSWPEHCKQNHPQTACYQLINTWVRALAFVVDADDPSRPAPHVPDLDPEQYATIDLTPGAHRIEALDPDKLVFGAIDVLGRRDVTVAGNWNYCWEVFDQSKGLRYCR